MIKVGDVVIVMRHMSRQDYSDAQERVMGRIGIVLDETPVTVTAVRYLHGESIVADIMTADGRSTNEYTYLLKKL